MSAGQGIITTMAFAVAYMMASDTIIQSLIKERQQNIKHQIMISGASKLAYWLSNYVIDISFHLIYVLVAWVTITTLKMDVPQASRMMVSFAFVNPMFVYALSFLFDSDSKASVVVRVLYFAMGGCAPIASQVL